MNLADLPSLPDLEFISGPGLAPGHDAFLLARWVDLNPEERILDLGTGQGVIALMLAARERVTVTGLDRDPAILSVARENSLRNLSRLKGRTQWLLADLRELPWDAGNEPGKGFCGFDLVVMNPPYRSAHTGRLPRDAHRAGARFELHGSLTDWATAAGRSLRPNGRVACVHLSGRSAELVSCFQSAGFGSIRLTGVSAGDQKQPTWIVLDARFSSK